MIFILTFYNAWRWLLVTAETCCIIHIQGLQSIVVINRPVTLFIYYYKFQPLVNRIENCRHVFSLNILCLAARVASVTNHALWVAQNTTTLNSLVTAPWDLHYYSLAVLRSLRHHLLIIPNWISNLSNVHLNSFNCVNELSSTVFRKLRSLNTDYSLDSRRQPLHSDCL